MARKSQNTTTNVVDSGATSSHDEDMQTSGHRTVGSKRKRAASKKQELIDNEATEKKLARLAKLEKENKKMKVKLFKQSKEAAKSKDSLDDSDDSDNSIESEDAPEVYQPIRFSSSIKSLGVVDGTPPKKLRKQAVGQRAALSAGSEDISTEDTIVTSDDNMAPHRQERGQMSSPTPSYRTQGLFYNDGDDEASHGQKRGRTPGSPAYSSYRTRTPSCDNGTDTASHGQKRGRMSTPASSHQAPSLASSRNDGEDAAPRGQKRCRSRGSTASFYRSRPPSCDDDIGTAPRGRKHGRTSSPASSYRTRTSSPSASPPSPNQKESKTPQTRPGVILSGKPKASDYDDIIKRRLLEAMSVYETYIFTDDAYPTQEVQCKRIREAWVIASADAEEQYELTNRMMRLVKDRGPRARGFLKDIIRPHIEKAYGFTPSVNKKIIQKNVGLYLDLMEERTFHYKDPAMKTGFAENAIIKKVLCEAFFRRRDDRGITHANSFNPIPLPLIALVLTAVEHCIEEWSTGTPIKANFEESIAAPLYNAHLKKLKNWHDLKPTVVNKILETLFKRCSRLLGASTGNSIPAMTDDVKEAARKELEARTGETESENSDG